jgi:hypothetical protein
MQQLKQQLNKLVFRVVVICIRILEVAQVRVVKTQMKIKITKQTKMKIKKQKQNAKA